MEEQNRQTILEAVGVLLTASGTGEYTETVIDRLASLGYVVTAADAFPLAYAMQKAEAHVRSQTNLRAIPAGLRYVYVDMACGEFLNAKYQTGQLDLSGLDFNGIVQSIHEGDSSVQFAAGASDEEKFKALTEMLNGGGADLLCYRRLRW